MVLKVYLPETFDEYPESILVNGKQPPRRMTGFRSFLTIIKDITTNYNINNGLNNSDVYSRMYLGEYSDWILLKNLDTIAFKIYNGWYRGVKVYPVLKGALKVKTRIGTLKLDGDESAVRPIILKHMEIE